MTSLVLQIESSLRPPSKIDEEALCEYGFTNHVKDQWYYCENCESMKNTSMDITIKPKEKKVVIDLLDNYFLQPLTISSEKSKLCFVEFINLIDDLLLNELIRLPNNVKSIPDLIRNNFNPCVSMSDLENFGFEYDDDGVWKYEIPSKFCEDYKIRISFYDGRFSFLKVVSSTSFKKQIPKQLSLVSFEMLEKVEELLKKNLLILTT